jgi:hypothetical protein
MKRIIFSTIIAASLLTACSSVYRTGQTPDDLYYSPAKEVVAKVKPADKPQEEYQEYVNSSEDRYLKMKAHNYNYWNSLDDYSYWNDSRYSYYNSIWSPYSYYSYNSSFFGFYGLGGNPYLLGWNPFFNSYYYGWGWSSGGWYSSAYIVNSYKNPTLRRTTGAANIFAYQNRTYSNNNNASNIFAPGSIANTSTNNFGTLVRRVFTPASNNNNNNNNNNSTWNSPVRVQSNSYTPTSSSAGGASGGYNSSGSSSSSGRIPRN